MCTGSLGWWPEGERGSRQAAVSGRQTQPRAVDRERSLRERKALHGKQTDLSACFPIGLVNLHRHSAAFTSQDGAHFSDAWIT